MQNQPTLNLVCKTKFLKRYVVQVVKLLECISRLSVLRYYSKKFQVYPVFAPELDFFCSGHNYERNYWKN